LERNQKTITAASSEKYVDIVGSFQTGYNISGIAPFGDLLVVFAYIPDEDDREKKFSTSVPSRQVIISARHSHCTL
jgi:vacuolar protein sorting-associated protein 41